MRDYKIITLKECESSNSFLKDRVDVFSPFTVLRCLNQTSGRGRWGRKWFSEEGKSLTFSILFPVFKSDDFIRYPVAVASSVMKTFAEYELKSSFLWPNDVYLKNKKICGILNESITRGEKSFFISGVGINVNLVKEDFPEPLMDKSISLKMILQKEVKVSDVFEVFLKKLKRELDVSVESILLFLKRNSLIKKGEKVKIRLREKEFLGKFAGFTEDFKIIVNNGKELVEFYDGEVLRVGNSDN